jgi:hypothetical protein
MKKFKKMMVRNTSVLTGKKNLEHLYTFKNFPVFMGCIKTPQKDDIVADMSWNIDKETGIIQLAKLLPLDVLYPEAHGAGLIGGLWDKHHKAFSDFLRSFHPSAVFEIGGSHGILANEYFKTKKIPWSIIEPNPDPIRGNKAKFIVGFFDEKFKTTEPFDVVVHSHLFEHIYKPDIFMKHLSGFMKNGKYLIFSIPHMEIMLKRKYTNCINFEHTIFLTEPYVEYLLAKHGFRLVKKEYFRDDHSIFYSAIKDDSVKPKKLPTGLYAKNKKLYREYISYHEKLIAKLNAKINKTEQKVYLFGAHVFAQYLISFGLDTSRIVCLLDNDPKKQSKRLYGSSLFVGSPKILKNENTPVVILKAGVYNDEIKKDILENINPQTIFWE